MMLNYIKADISRILKKKSFFIFIIINIILFEALVFVSSGNNLNKESYLSIIFTISSMIPLVIGIYIFSAVYLDDIRSKSIQSAIGYGISRSKIILVKLANIIIVSLISLISMFLVIILTSYFYQINLVSSDLITIIKYLLSGVVSLFLYSFLASIVVYSTFKTAVAMTAYVLLVTNTVYLIISLILNQNFIVNLVGDLVKYLPTQILSTISDSLNFNVHLKMIPIVMFSGYLILSYVLSTIMFKQKELEF